MTCSGVSVVEDLLQARVAVHRQVVVHDSGSIRPQLLSTNAQLLVLERDAGMFFGWTKASDCRAWPVGRWRRGRPRPRRPRAAAARHQGKRRRTGDRLGSGAAVLRRPGRGLQFDHRLIGAHADAAHLRDGPRRPRRASSASMAASVSCAPAASPHVPMPTVMYNSAPVFACQWPWAQPAAARYQTTQPCVFSMSPCPRVTPPPAHTATCPMNWRSSVSGGFTRPTTCPSITVTGASSQDPLQ